MNKRFVTYSLCLSLNIGLASFVYADGVDVSERVAAARTVSNDLITGLGEQLKHEMSTNGPVTAIRVCRDIAPAIANTASLATGWRVTRVSERPRNPMIGTADSWEQETLLKFKHQLTNVKVDGPLEYFEVVDEPFGKSFR